MIDLFRVIGLITVITLSSGIRGQDIEFYREDILFTIDGNVALTDGKYFFCNTGERNRMMTLLYPFPGNTIELIDSILIEDLRTNTIVPYRKSDSGIFFEIHIKSYEQASYRIYFRQNLITNHFCYILKSTSSWGRALEFANYELQMPGSMILDSLSYPPDTSFLSGEIQYYKWKKADFMPPVDFEVFFQSSPGSQFH
jgi:hypothetical protein